MFSSTGEQHKPVCSSCDSDMAAAALSLDIHTKFGVGRCNKSLWLVKTSFPDRAGAQFYRFISNSCLCGFLSSTKSCCNGFLMKQKWPHEGTSGVSLKRMRVNVDNVTPPVASSEMRHRWQSRWKSLMHLFILCDGTTVVNGKEWCIIGSESM